MFAAVVKLLCDVIDAMQDAVWRSLVSPDPSEPLACIDLSEKSTNSLP